LSISWTGEEGEEGSAGTGDDAVFPFVLFFRLERTTLVAEDMTSKSSAWSGVLIKLGDRRLLTDPPGDSDRAGDGARGPKRLLVKRDAFEKASSAALFTSSSYSLFILIFFCAVVVKYRPFSSNQNDSDEDAMKRIRLMIPRDLSSSNLITSIATPRISHSGNERN
jgi:hypothetical protein